MDTKKLFRFLSVIFICVLFVILTAALLGQRFYGNYQPREIQVAILEQESFDLEPPQKKTECLVVTNSEEANSAHAYNEIQGIFSQLKVRADYVDLSREELPAYDAYEKVVLAAEDYDQLGARASDLMDWVGNGGNLMIFFPPQAGSVFQSISAGLGIREVGREMYELPGIRMKTDFLLGGKGKDFMVEEPYESSLSLSLNEDCTVHIVSADDRELPVLWERKYKDGTIVFDNFGIMEKAYRGIHAAGYSLLGEAFAWPVINGSSFYLDDFPSPVPSGASEYIQRDYGISVKDFYTNVWWPDLLKLSEKYGCRYNGMVIEDYNDQVEAPFKPNQNIQRFQYFGSSLLKNGGEIGLHGYNHIPLCLKGFDKSFGDGYVQGTYDRLFDYGYWNSKEDMEAAMHELVRFTKKLFPQASASVYVPPSNILSEEARSILAEEFPDIKFIRVAILVVFVWIGGLKYFHYEADGIVPFVANSPFMSFFYAKDAPEYKEHKNPEGAFVPENRAWHEANNTYTFSYGLGALIMSIGILVFLGIFFPKVALIGDTLAIIMTLGTLSFLVTTPEVWVPNLGGEEFGFPLLSGAGRLVIKDIVILAGAVVLLSDSSQRVLKTLKKD